jgi:hypothetical protein
LLRAEDRGFGEDKAKKMGTGKSGHPRVLTMRIEEILEVIYFYRYMTAQDVSYLLFAPKASRQVRQLVFPLSP